MSSMQQLHHENIIKLINIEFEKLDEKTARFSMERARYEIYV
jgi:hypothetical protein